MAHDVFITYSADDKAVAEAVCATLESGNIRCWIAPRDVLPGTEWAEALIDAIDECRVVVLVLSSASNSSPQVIREVGRAASKGIPIIPLRIDDVTPSKSMEFFVSSHHFLDAQTPPLEKHLRQLTNTVQQLLTRKRVPPKGIEIAEAEEARRAKEWEAEEARKAKEAEERAKWEAEEARKAKEWEAEEARKAKEWEAEEARKAKEAELAAKEREKREAREAEERAEWEAEEARKAKKAEKVIAKRSGFWWVGIALLSAGAAFVGIMILIMPTLYITGEPWYPTFGVVLMFALPFVIPGVYCLRRAIARQFRDEPATGGVPNWWWWLPIVLGFLGGAISWVKQRDVNWRTARNMLTLGILATFLWAIPFFILVSPVTPPAPSLQLLYEDDFSNPHTGWISESTEEVEAGYQDGEYHILVKERDWWYFVWNPRAGQFADFTLEVVAKLVSGPTVSSCGIVFHTQDSDNCYRFLVSADGYYAVGILLNGTWIDLQPWTKSAFINQGNSINHLKVVCQGSQIEVSANGHHLTTVTDDSFSEGYVGMIVDTSEPNARFAFDDVRVYGTSLPPPTPTPTPTPLPEKPLTAADIPELAELVARGQVNGDLLWNPFKDLLVKPDGTPFRVAFTFSTLGPEPCMQAQKMLEDFFPRFGLGPKGGNWTSFDPNFDLNAQIGWMEDMATTFKPDWIMCHSVSAELEVPVAEKVVYEYGVPIFTADCGIDSDAITSFIAHKFEGPGGTDVLGDWMIDELQRRGYGPDNPCTVLELWGMREMLTAQLRHEGFHSVVDNYPWITVIESADTNWSLDQTANITMDVVAAHPEIVAIWHHGCGGAGMVPGLEAIGRLYPVDDPDHIIIASNDAEIAMWDAIHDNRADVVSTHGLAEPIDICFQVAVTSVVFGQPVDSFYQCPYIMVDASNISTVQIGGVPPYPGWPRGRWDLWLPADPEPDYGFPQPSLELRMLYMGY